MGIDLEKYAGHTPGPWAWDDKDYCGLSGACNDSVLTWASYEGMHVAYGQQQHANARLIAAAPALLAEVVRLRADLAEAVTALDDVTRLIIGECPALLDGDRDGDGRLALRIDAVLAKHGGGK